MPLGLDFICIVSLTGSQALMFSQFQYRACILVIKAIDRFVYLHHFKENAGICLDTFFTNISIFSIHAALEIIQKVAFPTSNDFFRPSLNWPDDVTNMVDSSGIKGHLLNIQ